METELNKDFVCITIDDGNVLKIPRKFGKYNYIRTIGNGSFSAVILVSHFQTQERYACKVVSRQLLVEQNVFDRFEQEVRILESLRHPNIVKMDEIVFGPELIFLIMEYCSRGELFKHIVTQGALEEAEVCSLFRQITQGLAFVHSRDIAHRDLKPENILLDENFVPKLADFGLCHQTSAKALLMTPCGSPFYAPPEIISNQKYDGKKADIWSLGVVLYTMSTGALPWTETNQTQLFLQIQEAEINIPPQLTPPLQQILSMMLSREPEQRPSCEQLLAMPWLSVEDDLELVMSTSSLRSRVNTSSTKSTDDAWKATQSGAMKKPLNVRPPNQLDKANTNTLSQASVMAPISSLVRKVPPNGRRRIPK